MTNKRIPIFPLIPRRRVLGVGFGSFISHAKGIGYDYYGSREWQPGDDPRRTNQQLSARESFARDEDVVFINEHHAERSIRVAVFVDRAPRMALYPAWTSWLDKPALTVRAGQSIVASAKAAGAMVGYLDFADWGIAKSEHRKIFFRPPNQETESVKIERKYLPHEHFTAPEDNLERGLKFLLSRSADVPQDTFLFIISDFLVMPPKDLLRQACRLDVVPVVVEDPCVESSFPVWKESWLTRVLPFPPLLPLGDQGFPGSGAAITLPEAKVRRASNIERAKNIRATFRELSIEPVWLSSSDESEIYREFAVWANRRRGR